MQREELSPSRKEKYGLKHLLRACLLGLALLPFAGVPAADTGCIGLVAASADKFWDQMHDGARAAGREFGYRIYFRESTREEVERHHEDVLGELAALQCAGVLLAPSHEKQKDSIEALAATGFLTVFVDRGLPGVDDVPLVATDNYAAGRFAAGKLIERLPPAQRKLAVFRLDPAIPSTAARERGFIDEATSRGYEIVLDRYAGTTIGDIRFVIPDLLAGLREPVHGVFAPNETTTVGVVEGVLSASLAQPPVIVGFDVNQYIRAAIKRGQLAGTVIQKPYEMGYQGVQLIHWHLAAGKPLQSIVTGVEFVTRETLRKNANASE